VKVVEVVVVFFILQVLSDTGVDPTKKESPVHLPEQEVMMLHQNLLN
jgi:hypothetical protein